MRLVTQLGWVLLAVVTIYWNSTPVLSLPPSLIANAASLRLSPGPVQLAAKDPRSGGDANRHKNLSDAERVNGETPPLSSSLLLLAPADVAPNSFAVSGRQGEVVADEDRGSAVYLYDSYDNDDNEPADVDFVASAEMQPGPGDGRRYDGLDGRQDEQELKRQLPLSSGYEAKANEPTGNKYNSQNKHNNYNENHDNDYEDDDDNNNNQEELLSLPRFPAAMPSVGKSHTPPKKPWPLQCRLNNNCLQEYYTNLFAGRYDPSAAPRDLPELAGFQPRDSSIAALLHSGQSDPEQAGGEYYLDGGGRSFGKQPAHGQAPGQGNAETNDIYMLMNGERSVANFLHWAMQQLYPGNSFANGSDSGADTYHSGMFLWKKLNSSGRLEPPLMVDEPHYIIVRRETLQEKNGDDKYEDIDEFIPARGRKDDRLNLDALMQRYETFVPTRGRRDNIRDLFKSDDLFYPHRGKKSLKNPAASRWAWQRYGHAAGETGDAETAAAANGDNQSVKMSLAPAAWRAMSTRQPPHQHQHEEQQQQPAATWQVFDEQMMPTKQWAIAGARWRRGWTAGARMAMANNRLHSARELQSMPPRGYHHQQPHNRQRYSNDKHLQQRRSMAPWFVGPTWRRLAGEPQKLARLPLSPAERVQHPSLGT